MKNCDCTVCAYSKRHPQLNAPRCWHVTVDTITDEQIREVLMLDEPEEAFAVATLAATGNTYTNPSGRATDEQRRAARARCAEILNARKETP